MNTEAVVCMAREHLNLEAGWGSEVYNAAGSEEVRRYIEEKIGFVPKGDAFITPGFQLDAE